MIAASDGPSGRAHLINGAPDIPGAHVASDKPSLRQLKDTETQTDKKTEVPSWKAWEIVSLVDISGIYIYIYVYIYTYIHVYIYTYIYRYLN